jgi:hypothetical protein
MTGDASGVLVVSEAALKRFGLTPMARVVNLTVTAGDPFITLEKPIPARRKALERSGLRLEDIHLFEVNETFASLSMAWLKVINAAPRSLTSMAVRLRLAIHSAPRASSSRRSCSTHSGAAAAATVSKLCAMAAASRTRRSSSVCDSLGVALIGATLRTATVGWRYADAHSVG